MTLHNRLYLTLSKLLLGLLLGALLLFVSVMGYVWYCGQARPVSPAPAAIVLGAAAWGNRPSPVFKERIAHAVHLYQTEVVQQLVFTGGALRDDLPSEGEVGARWAIKLGVAAADTAYETTSRDTWNNLKNAKAILQQQDIESVILVSDYFHLARAGIMARDLGLQAQLSPTPTSKFKHFPAAEKLKLYSKESYFIIGYWLQQVFDMSSYQSEI